MVPISSESILNISNDRRKVINLDSLMRHSLLIIVIKSSLNIPWQNFSTYNYRNLKKFQGKNAFWIYLWIKFNCGKKMLTIGFKISKFEKRTTFLSEDITTFHKDNIADLTFISGSYLYLYSFGISWEKYGLALSSACWSTTLKPKAAP